MLDYKDLYCAGESKTVNEFHTSKQSSAFSTWRTHLEALSCVSGEDSDSHLKSVDDTKFSDRIDDETTDEFCQLYIWHGINKCYDDKTSKKMQNSP